MPTEYTTSSFDFSRAGGRRAVVAFDGGIHEQAQKECRGSPKLLVRDRRDALDRWQQAKSDGLTAQAAANAVDVSRATLYRWRNLRDRRRLVPQSRCPHHLRQPAWSPDPNGVVEPAAPVGEPGGP